MFTPSNRTETIQYREHIHTARYVQGNWIKFWQNTNSNSM